MKLISTNYQCSAEIRPGDIGTIKEITKLPDRLGGNRQIWTRFDSGITLALIDGEDCFEVLE